MRETVSPFVPLDEPKLTLILKHILYYVRKKSLQPVREVTTKRKQAKN